MKLFPKLALLAYIVLLPWDSFADFKFSDFAGDYISYSSSAGGNTTLDPHSAAVTSIAQFTLKKDGTGKLNFLNVSVFFSTATQSAQNYTDLPILYTIDNRCIGVGSLTVSNFPVPGVNQTSTFVASKGPRKSKHRSGLVEKIFSNANSNSPSNVPLRTVSIVIAHRQ
jgi:hypothetical protein